MERAQRERFEQAVERKREEAERRAQGGGPRGEPGAEGAGKPGGQEEQLHAPERPQDIPDPRKKSSGHGQKTADKWNQ
ncbi:hypothetical protein [Conexibacter arvalis]|uniref:Uncharacterized protein n=1 Tax=Conexibacter arvalis TaxID=912552 RepID=A0A840IJK0_9ACTN|nr:hypothetical protein [Conexibacter arvalis]MBB4665202.1 hypothetical protein [Conexibacter arvalis]